MTLSPHRKLLVSAPYEGQAKEDGMMDERPTPYIAGTTQHGAALGRALAYCLIHNLGKVSYEQVQGTIHGVDHGRVRFVFEVDSAAFFSAMTELRERFGLPRKKA